MTKFNRKFSLDKSIQNSKFDYCKNLKYFLVAPAILIVVGIILLCTLGFNLGIDFTGGSVINVYANSAGDITGKTEDGRDIRAYDLKDDGDYNDLRNAIQSVLDDYGFKIKIFRATTMEVSFSSSDNSAVEVQYQDTNGASKKEIQTALQKYFGYSDNGTQFWSEGVTEPTITTATASNELLMNCFIAMLVALALILIYIGFRFELTSGLAAILALFHDLIIMSCFVLIFRIQINASFVAALVTILGYSINNTIIIFDRIRENRKSGKYELNSNGQIKVSQNSKVANDAVKETMTRSIFTTLTTLITIALVAIIGVADIREFALPIIFGIIAGFYSSVFLTPGLWAIAYRPRKKKAKNKAQKA